jgi:hypothetical protein
MRSTPERDAWLRERLIEAVKQFAGGSRDKFGRLLGYTNGGYIREIIDGKKPVREAILERACGVKELAGWFEGGPDAVFVSPEGTVTLVEMKVPSADTGFEVSPEERDLVLAYRDLPPRKQRELLDQLMLEAEEYRQYGAGVLARYGAKGIVSNERAAEMLPPAPAAPPPVSPAVVPLATKEPRHGKHASRYVATDKIGPSISTGAGKKRTTTPGKK